MKGELAQAVALVCHGNAILQGRWNGPFSPSNSTCIYCEWVRFVRPQKRTLLGAKETEIARTPDEWFRWLAETGSASIRLVPVRSVAGPLPKRIASAFAGNSDGNLEVLREDGTRGLWKCRWELGDRKASGSRIWRVTYGEVCEESGREHSNDSLDAACGGLREALEDIVRFAERETNGAFVGSFETALNILGQTTIVSGKYYPDLAPYGILPRGAASLLNACQVAWVFGGMGSWKDQLFEGEIMEEYNRVSERLYNALMTATRAAANASTGSSVGMSTAKP